jgi:hypothetical protein
MGKEEKVEKWKSELQKEDGRNGINILQELERFQNPHSGLGTQKCARRLSKSGKPLYYFHFHFYF